MAATAQQRGNFELMPMGIHWPDIDEDLSVAQVEGAGIVKGAGELGRMVLHKGKAGDGAADKNVFPEQAEIHRERIRIGGQRARHCRRRNRTWRRRRLLCRCSPTQECSGQAGSAKHATQCSPRKLWQCLLHVRSLWLELSPLANLRGTAQG